MKAMMEDMGILQRKITLKTDTSAAKGIARGRGLGKIRHIEVTQLWLQDKVSSKEIEVLKMTERGTQLTR